MLSFLSAGELSFVLLSDSLFIIREFELTGDSIFPNCDILLWRFFFAVLRGRVLVKEFGGLDSLVSQESWNLLGVPLFYVGSVSLHASPSSLSLISVYDMSEIGL